MNRMEAMHIESLAPSRKDVAAILGNCKGCSKSGLHSFTDDIPYECFLHEQLCTEIQTEASAEFAIRGLHSRLNSLIRLDNHKRAIITIEKCLDTIDPRRRATALWTCNTRRKAIAHLEARIQHDNQYLAFKHGIFAESRAAIIRIQNSIDKFHENLMDKIRQADEGAYETEERLDRSWHEGAASAASPMPFEQVRGTAQEDVQYRGRDAMSLRSFQDRSTRSSAPTADDIIKVKDFTPMVRRIACFLAPIPDETPTTPNIDTTTRHRRSNHSSVVPSKCKRDRPIIAGELNRIHDHAKAAAVLNDIKNQRLSPSNAFFSTNSVPSENSNDPS
ncbi:hypothetical protein GQ607_008088 [Colletotrichum asianum]|uniref:Uncharacterized protein n=1 Tax=Colletotrichum asianum TaxID=702518 RepID=A0A8H3WCR9_9PEZI|nr:hypothetical protein GQ607_008088 [Colletotrichum asianum]